MLGLLRGPPLCPGEAHVTWTYRCSRCGAAYPVEPGRYLCGPCAAKRLPGRPLEGILECTWEGDWRFSGIPLPVEREYFPVIPVGDTPLWAPDQLRALLAFPRLFIKDDTREPSGSLKDRASVLVAAFARKHGIGEVALASTGNAASSMAAVGAAAGIEVTVFLPRSAPAAKRIQVLQYGARLRLVDGTYDLAVRESRAYTESTGVLSRNTAYNPLTIEGKKTVSFEIASDLAAAAGKFGSYDSPKEVFVPVGDGAVIAGVYRGFEDLVKLGHITRMPRVWACQAAGSSAIARAFASGGFGDPLPSATLADSISVDVPSNGSHALSKLRKYDGRVAVVSDEEILSAQRLMSSKAGLFAEPSSCATLAGLIKVRNSIDPSSAVVLLATGSGLKDIKSAAAAVGAEL